MQKVVELYKEKFGVELTEADIERSVIAIARNIADIKTWDMSPLDDNNWRRDNGQRSGEEAEATFLSRSAAGDWILEKMPSKDAYFIVDYTGDEKSLRLPTEVEGMKIESVSWGIFLEYADIEELIIPGEYGYIAGRYNIEYLFSRPSMKRLIVEDGIKSIRKEAFNSCSDLEYVSLPGSMEYVPCNCFQKCSRLEKLDLSDGTVVIEVGAFSECCLKELILPGSVSEIQAYAFSENRELKTVEGIRDDMCILSDAFAHCTELLDRNGGIVLNGTAFGAEEWICDVVLGDDVRKLGDQAFWRSSVMSVEMADSVEELGWHVFQQCTDLRCVSLSRNIKVIPEGTFLGCTALKRIRIPAGVEKIEKNAFKNCEALEEVYIENDDVKIDGSAFRGCPAVKINPEKITDDNLYRMLDNTFKDTDRIYEEMKFPKSRTYKLDIDGEEYRVKFRAGKKIEQMAHKFMNDPGRSYPYEMFDAEDYFIPAEEGRLRCYRQEHGDVTYEEDDLLMYSYIGAEVGRGARVLTKAEFETRIIFMATVAEAFTDEDILREIVGYAGEHKDDDGIAILALSGMVLGDAEIFCITAKEGGDREVELTAALRPFRPGMMEESRNDFLQGRHAELFNVHESVSLNNEYA